MDGRRLRPGKPLGNANFGRGRLGGGLRPTPREPMVREQAAQATVFYSHGLCFRVREPGLQSQSVVIPSVAIPECVIKGRATQERTSRSARY